MSHKSLVGKEVCFTGRLASMTRPEAEKRAASVGARHVSFPAATTSYLVIGEAMIAGNLLTRSLTAFKELKESGSTIELVREAEFLKMIGAEEEILDFSRLYTPAQVGRIAEVPLAEVRAWIRHGLLQPVRLSNRLPWFEYGDIILARSLNRVSASGMSVPELRKSLAAISRWFPDGDRILNRLSVAEKGVKVKLADGGWADQGGQRLLDFEEHGPVNLSHFPFGEETIFARAADAEELGDLEDAVCGYRQACEWSDEPAIRFNLGNVLFEMGREGEAAESYLSALALDGGYVEAWNNLGNSLAALGRNLDAVKAYRKALEIEPDFPDAHCNLAVVLEALGQRDEAEAHRSSCDKAYPPVSRLRLLRGDEEC